MQAYSPLGGQPRKLATHPTLLRIAARHNVTAVQVLLRWLLDRGHAIVTKSLNGDHLAENLGAAHSRWGLAATELAVLDALRVDAGEDAGVPSLVGRYAPSFEPWNHGGIPALKCGALPAGGDAWAM